MAKTLVELVQYLERLQGRAPLHRLVEELSDLEIDCDEVASYIRFHNRSYSRNLVRGGEWYNLLVLCWKNGQRSPIHDHAASSCGVRVLRGTMTETLFEFTPNGHVKAMFSREMEAGCVCGSEDDNLHQVSNLQAGDADLVTLHIYSPPLLQMKTYSLFDRETGFEPMFVEFSDAAGI